MSNENANRRTYYRLRYPLPERPLININNSMECVVTEISEYGARLLMDNEALQVSEDMLNTGWSFYATIKFMDGGTEQVNGIGLRFDGNELIVKFNNGIVFNRILHEQLCLRRKYPVRYLREVSERKCE